MPRKKKDGRYINYYIDRTLFERLEKYAYEKGQSLTTAIERILKEHLDRYDSEQRKGEQIMYCPNCNILTDQFKCPVCGSQHTRAPMPDDYCLLSEKQTVWADSFSEILTQNGIPFVTKNLLGTGLAAKMGPALERVRFYVPFSHYQNARELENAFFHAAFAEEQT